jgi:hypothetical protein
MTQTQHAVAIQLIKDARETMYTEHQEILDAMLPVYEAALDLLEELEAARWCVADKAGRGNAIAHMQLINIDAALKKARGE